MTQFGQHSKPANGKRLQGLEALELPPSKISTRLRSGTTRGTATKYCWPNCRSSMPLGYGKRRKAAAKKLGITTATLDKIVAERRVRRSAQTGPETLLPHWDVEPWHEPVASDQLLGAIVERIRAHVVMNQDAAVAVALWVAFSWVHNKAAVHSPLLLVTSAEPNSGKTSRTRHNHFRDDVAMARIDRQVSPEQPTQVSPAKPRNQEAAKSL